MTVTNAQTGTNVVEIADRVYRISTPIPATAVPIPGGFTFNQFLIVDDAPLLFHTGMRGLFPLVREAVESVIPVERLRYVSYSHHEPDEDGSVDAWLQAAPGAQVLCGQVGAMLNGGELARPPHVLADGEELSLGGRKVRWIDTPHLPHAWECGFLAEERTRTLLCGDLFTQPGAEHPPVTEADIFGPSEAFRQQLDYFAHTKQARGLLERLAATQPALLACMHGSAWRGDGANLLRALANAVSD